MGALLIINYDVTDPIGIAGYREKAAPILGGPDKGAGRSRRRNSRGSDDHRPPVRIHGTGPRIVELTRVSSRDR